MGFNNIVNGQLKDLLNQLRCESIHPTWTCFLSELSECDWNGQLCVKRSSLA